MKLGLPVHEHLTVNTFSSPNNADSIGDSFILNRGS
jgi:hypothetical protein